MISVRYQGKPFNITEIQVCDPTSNAEEAEVECFYEELQDLLELHTIRSDQISRSVVSDSLRPHGLYSPWNSLGQNTGVGSVQFSSVAQSCPTLCDPMNRSIPGLLVHHQLPEFTQTHVHQVSDAIQPSHPLSSPSPPAPNPSQNQSLFQ